ncbi:MAG: peptidoglycan-binding protein [Acidobacteria bacterium]|nr:MAG: peptidoglycan-binding protein [Acidobacteriota bacterium]
MKVQSLLKKYDYYDGPVDGVMSAALRQAIKTFQENEGLKATGELDQQTYKRILALEEEAEQPTDEPPGAQW